MPLRLPREDEDLRFCLFCRKWHGFEVFCPTTCARWLKYWYGLFKKLIGRLLERFAYAVAVFALGCFAIALLIGLADLLRGLILQ